jgi:GNAT superfamily N-acetyltransferase
VRQGIDAPELEPDEEWVARLWERRRPLVEFIAAQPGGRYWIAEHRSGKAVGYARVVRFGALEELSELMVDEDHQGLGVARELLARCWPGDPTPDLGRVVIAAGSPADLSTYMGFGVMPIAGHWHLRMRTAEYLEARALETDTVEPDVHVLTAARAAREWKRLEPPAVGHERAALHDFFGRDRTCLATLDENAQATAVCWVSSEGEIGPAVAASPEELVPVLLQALDRVGRSNEPEYLGVYATSLSWWVLKRLRGLGFKVFWPSWVMCSVPLPGLDRYLATRPPHLL